MTRLEQEVARESDVNIDGRKIIVSMSGDNGGTVRLRLKGLRDDGKSVAISDLWSLLGGDSKPTIKPIRRKDDDELYVQPKDKDVKRILNDLRSHNIMSDLTYQEKVKFEGIIKSMLDVYA